MIIVPDRDLTPPWEYEDEPDRWETEWVDDEYDYHRDKEIDDE